MSERAGGAISIGRVLLGAGALAVVGGAVWLFAEARAPLAEGATPLEGRSASAGRSLTVAAPPPGPAGAPGFVVPTTPPPVAAADAPLVAVIDDETVKNLHPGFATPPQIARVRHELRSISDEVSSSVAAHASMGSVLAQLAAGRHRVEQLTQNSSDFMLISTRPLDELEARVRARYAVAPGSAQAQ